MIYPHVQVITGREVFDKFSDAEFRQRWGELHDTCPWSTSMQSLPFVEAWYNSYRSAYDPVLVTAKNDKAELIGLFPLAVQTMSKRLVNAGDNLCEYGTWLAEDPKIGNDFIVKALNALRDRWPNTVLQFLYLAEGTPLEWLKKHDVWNRKCELVEIKRPLLTLEKVDNLHAVLSKKKVKTRLRQLERFGSIEFVQVKDIRQFEAIFDEAHVYSDLRFSATARSTPFADPFKKPFYLELFKAGLLHVTLLKVGNRAASIHINLRNRDQVLLGVTSFSPLFAKYSPSKFHIPMLGIDLARHNVAACDLTPGGNYKEKHANSYDVVHVLNIYFSSGRRLKATLSSNSSKTAKRVMEAMNVDRETIEQKLYDTRYRLKFITPASVFKKLARSIRTNRKPKEFRIYAFNVDRLHSIVDLKIMSRDRLEDLLKYQPSESWDLTPSAFHKMAIKRLDDGNHVYTRVEHDALVHCGWLVERQEKCYFPEVGQDFTLAPNSSVLFDFFTHPRARGKGLYQQSLSQMLHDAARIPGTRQIYISVLADNAPSRHVIEKIGFEYVVSLYG